MKNKDWNKFCVRLNVKAEPQTIYNAWTTRAGLESWFLRIAEFTKPDGTVRPGNEHIQAGDTYEWLWHGHPDSVVERNKVLETNGKDRLQFTFSGDCIVTVTIKTEAGENIVEICQEDIPAEEDPKQNLYVQCSIGWTFYLANLKSILEGGLDLRNKNEALRSVLNS